MIDIGTILRHYKRDDVQQAIIDNSANREVAVKFGDKGFGHRPDTLSYRGDVLELAKQGATSFHASEEHWKNPLHLDVNMRKKDLEDLRIGWDLLLDIDCQFLEYSQIAAELLIKALRHHGLESVTVKFSGNHGFHIGVPFSAFPESVYGTETRLLFPEGPRRIAEYLKEMIREPLAARMLEKESLPELLEKTGKKFAEVVKSNLFDPFTVLSLDTILISSRHLYRMPYSFNEKSGMVSIVLEDISKFDIVLAKPENISVSKVRFLNSDVEKGEAKKLIVQAFDFLPEESEKEIVQKREFEVQGTSIPAELFPPCVHNIMKGMDDGKKRSLFILVNFLTTVGWGYDEIEKFLHEWNKKNPEPLREQLIVGHLRYHKQQKKRVLPPNCANNMYYVDMRICTPDNFCPRIKNPANYAILKAKSIMREKEK